MEKDIRWKQRFENLEKAYLFLEEAIQKPAYDQLQAAGLIKSFEFTFELSWKTLKDYLELKGMAVQFPRDVIKQAFQSGLITDGHLWIEMLDKRNELTHTYDDRQAEKAVQTVKQEFFPALAQVYHTLKTKCLN